MIKNKKIITLFITIMIILIPLNSNAMKVYGGNNFSLRKSNNDLILSIKYDFETRETDILRFKNYNSMLNPINIKEDFIDKDNRIHEYDSSILKVGNIPHIFLNGPMEIISLNDNIWFDTLILNESNNKYSYTGYYYFLDGISEYKVSVPGNAFETKVVETGDESEFTSNLDKKNTSYQFLKTRKNGKILSKKGTLNIDGKESYHNNFLLTGNIRNSNKKLPPILITVDYKDKPIIKQIKKEKPQKEISNIKSNFKDIKNTDWYFNDIHDLVDKKVLKGYLDGTFKPKQQISYGEFLKAALSSATEKEYPSKKGEHWAKGYYDEAVKLKVLKKTDLKPTHKNFNKNISREDMAYILININEKVQNSTSIKAKSMESEIKDFYMVSSNRKKHVLQAYSKGLIKGKDGKFDPKSSTTRAEAAVVIKRLLEY